MTAAIPGFRLCKTPSDRRVHKGLHDDPVAVDLRKQQHVENSHKVINRGSRWLWPRGRIGAACRGGAIRARTFGTAPVSLQGPAGSPIAIFIPYSRIGATSEATRSLTIRGLNGQVDAART